MYLRKEVDEVCSGTVADVGAIMVFRGGFRMRSYCSDRHGTAFMPVVSQSWATVRVQLLRCRLHPSTPGLHHIRRWFAL